MKNIIKIRYSNWYNLQLNDKHGIIATFKEIELFKQSGGGTIVDKNSRLNRNISALKALSEATNVNIIIGTGMILQSV